MDMTLRRSGVLLHIASLPTLYGIGDLGPAAHNFVAFLAQAGQKVWQILPLAPVNPGAGNSPYSSYSAFAGNTLFISPEFLLRDGLVRERDVHAACLPKSSRVDYTLVYAQKERLLHIAFDTVFSSLGRHKNFQAFVTEHAVWLEPYALFLALKAEFRGLPWYAWPLPLRLQDPGALAETRKRLGFAVLKEQFFQYLFWQQWLELRAYAGQLGIAVLGDAPIYVSLDSSDVWANRRFFQLDGQGLPLYAAGAPPDYFSATGQMWGNPVYDWQRLEEEDFSFWIERLRHEAKRYDLVRLDHFRGFCAFWQVPAGEPTAENGVWRPAPGAQLFKAVREVLPDLTLIAEDLGVITADVVALMRQHAFPGMKVLQFAFSEDAGQNPYLPHNIARNSIVFTGTHDNNTTRGWFVDEIGSEIRQRLSAYLGYQINEMNVSRALIRLAQASVACTAIVPMQDYLDLGSQDRMNTPGLAEGNWGWRLHSLPSSALAEEMRALSLRYGRLGDTGI